MTLPRPVYVVSPPLAPRWAPYGGTLKDIPLAELATLVIRSTRP